MAFFAFWPLLQQVSTLSGKFPSDGGNIHCLGAATMGLVVRSTTNGVIGLLRVRLLAVALRAACEAVGSVGDGFLHLVHGGLLGVRSHLLLSLCCGMRIDLCCLGWGAYWW